MDRRKFLETNVIPLGAAFVANWGSRTEIRAYAQRGKPLLTERNLNRFFEEAHSKGATATQARAARTNLVGFLHENFSLSPQQERTVAQMTPAERSALDRLLAVAESGKSPVVFSFVNVEAKCRTVASITTPRGPQTVTIESQ